MAWGECRDNGSTLISVCVKVCDTSALLYLLTSLVYLSSPGDSPFPRVRTTRVGVSLCGSWLCGDWDQRVGQGNRLMGDYNLKCIILVT